jgi:phosphoribosylamine--glycine ligase
MARPHASNARKNAAPLPDALNILLIGGGGREHALAWRLKRSKSCKNLYATHRENPGIAELAQPIGFDFSMRELYRVEQFIAKNNINLVVVGPEDPLAGGIADRLASSGALVFGPTAAGAQLEADKGWAKKLMRSASVPTAEAREYSDPEQAKAAIQAKDELPVIKAVGLAAGKGVIVPASRVEALAAIDEIMVKKAFGDAGSRVVLEQKLTGPEVSVFALVDGQNILLLDACQDHKRLGDNDTGPNTGGMGAYCPTPLATPALLEEVWRNTLLPTIDALKREEIDYRGVLYCGLMLTPSGPKVLEYNVRFGDPECQCLVRRIAGDFARLLYATAAGRLDQAEVDLAGGPVCCVVLASGGYPAGSTKGVEIVGVEEAEQVEGVTVFHAGTIRKNGKLLTNGGRVLNVVAQGDTIEQARERAYRAAERIHFTGKTFRTDIAHQAITHQSGAHKAGAAQATGR